MKRSPLSLSYSIETWALAAGTEMISKGFLARFRKARMDNAARLEASPELPNSVAQCERIRRIANRGPAGRLRHCLSVAAEIRGPVDEAELRARLDGLIARRPALGSMFTGHGTHRLAGGSTELRRQAVTGPDAASRWRAAIQIADFEGRRPFFRGEHPLVRGMLLSPEDDHHLLVLTVDQLVGDSWSANLIIGDLFGAGSARDSREPDGYAAVWRERQDWLAGSEGTTVVTERRRHLADARWRWPIHPDPDEDRPGDVHEQFLALEDPVAAALRARVRQSRGSVLAVAAMALVLGVADDVADTRDQPFALLTTLAGRETVAEQEAVGWFATDAAIRLPARRGTVHEYLTALRGEIFAALAAQRVPGELLAATAADAHQAGPTCALVYLPRELSGGPPGGQYRLGTAAVSRAAVSVCPTGADIDFYLLEDPPPMTSAPPAALTVGALADGGVADARTVSSLLRRWAATLTVLSGLPWSSTPVTEGGGLSPWRPGARQVRRLT